MLNRPVRTRLQGGVGGGIREDSPYPDLDRLRRLGLNLEFHLRAIKTYVELHKKVRLT
ncbi:hypothetical protein XM38_008570 [Halomicronema hongdechloris C2206]|uniref:Uncharacterized protein n=1 Tax=Halomicronema hongdechloris C2206 TaxID=1641165 RepID=A0A1Z3HIK1_9CYAN|nr:hypothetical protein XM38_008570 [Halomicronema hongdechloris C2206]